MRYLTFKYTVILKPGLGVTHHQNRHGSIRLLRRRINSNHGPISYSFRDKRRFQLKIANFSRPVYFAPHGNWVPTLWIKGATGPRKKSDDIFSCLDTIRECDRRTDRHRATAKTALTHSVAR